MRFVEHIECGEFQVHRTLGVKGRRLAGVKFCDHVADLYDSLIHYLQLILEATAQSFSAKA